MIPSFAVVGHPNKGKSSIVATLAEDDQVRISRTPGTTRVATRYTFTVDGRPLYTLVDTPGFQRARAVLAWLNEHAATASERSGLIRTFVEAHVDDPAFHDERELLQPIIDGAGILYVVDGAKPYGPEYELEMEILRWTGRPRMALINTIGEGHHVDEWRDALGQFFSIVRVFDAVHADFEKRIDLLRAFGELEESWRDALNDAIRALQADRTHRVDRSAAIIAAAIGEAMTRVVSAPLDEANQVRQGEQLKTALLDDIRRIESRAREDVQALYRHTNVELIGSAALELDLFAEKSWQLFGLSKRELVMAASVSGAVFGGALDLMVGGTSFMLGAALGAGVAGASAFVGASELAKIKVLGTELGGDILKAGPVSDPNFPWVLLGRAWLHHAVVSERNHARREAMELDAVRERHVVDRLPGGLRRSLAAAFRHAKDGDIEDLGHAMPAVLALERDQQ